MKFTQRSPFEKHLKDAAPQHFAPVYVLIAKDIDERKECEQHIITALLGSKKSRREALCLFDGEHASIGTIMQELQSHVFFVKQRVVLIRQADKLAKPALQQLEQYFAHPHPSIFLVISTTTINRASNFYKKAEKVGVMLDLAEENPREKEQAWISRVMDRGQKRGKRIDAKTARYLLHFIGMDYSLLPLEIEKLISYVGDRETVTEADVRSICTKGYDDNVWQLGDAIFSSRPAAAFSIAHALVSEGVPFFSLLRQIRTQFQTKCRLCDILSLGGGLGGVQQQFPYMRGNIFQQHAQMARQYGMRRLTKGILLIDDVERLAKNSALSQELLLERLLFTLTTMPP
ncbi:MAG: DNA polymerase III subunit delta [Waddliaceae bacterium]